jgi:hypothetical protein
VLRGVNLGLMNPQDDPHEPLVTFVRDVNRRVEVWHIQGVSAGE